MSKIHFILPDGKTQNVTSETGMTIMEIAVRNAIPNIDAECGGACACATCHVYIEEPWKSKLIPPAPMEEDMLDFAFDIKDTSRLSCQIRLTDDMDGLTVRVPTKQA